MSKDILTHRGFNGSVEPSVEDGCLHGRILFIDDVITYEGETIAEIDQAFQGAVDRYLAHCERTGRLPNKPYSGSFNIRTGAELHRDAVVAAAKAGTTLNDFVCQALRARIELPNGRVEHSHTHEFVITVQDGAKFQSQWLPSSGGEAMKWSAGYERERTH